MSDCWSKGKNGQAGEPQEKPVQSLPTSFRKTQLSPKLLEF